MEEVVVTATKRGETPLQDTAMSISAIGQQTIEYLGADELLDYLLLVPNVSFTLATSTGGRDDTRPGRHVTIRGIDSGPDGVPTTAFYIDDTPIALMDPRLFDINRVEVLRGPQGTLYGANSMGGTVRIVTNKPRFDRLEYQTDVTGAYMPEGEPSFYANAMINLPLAENVALRAVGVYRKEGGFIDNVGVEGVPDFSEMTTESDVNDEQVEGARLALSWQANDALRITPSVYYQNISIDGTPQYEPDTGDLLFADRRVAEEQENDFTLINLEVEYDFGRDITLFSSMAWFDTTTTVVDDFTKVWALFGLPADPFQSSFVALSADRFTWETRLTGAFGDDANWLLGGFFLDEKFVYQQHVPIDNIDGCPAEICGVMLGPDDSWFTGIQTNNDQRLAIFGEVTWSLNDYWDITGGLRWFSSDADQRADFDGFFNGGPSTTTGESSETDVSPKLQVAYRPDEDNMIYGVISKGFRPGGPTDIVPPDLCGEDLANLGLSEPLSQFDADTLWNYEAGYKGTMAEGRVTLNAATFFMDWTDVQQSVRLSCGFGFVGNVGSAESKGLELEMTAQLSDYFSIFAAAGYTDAEFTETSEEVGVTEGDRIRDSAKFTGSLSGLYQKPISAASTGYIQALLQHSGNKVSQGLVTGASQTLPSITTFDLRLGLLRDSWELVLWGKNLTDERGQLQYWDYQPAALDHINVMRPRTFGVTFRYFGAR
jgi:outer membrane receptor protein involved in Fe transport